MRFDSIEMANCVNTLTGRRYWLFVMQMMCGYLRGRGIIVQRDRVRASMRRTDALGTAARWSRTATRRVYSVQTPNALWHIDSHLKLVRCVIYIQFNM